MIQSYHRNEAIFENPFYLMPDEPLCRGHFIMKVTLNRISHIDMSQSLNSYPIKLDSNHVLHALFSTCIFAGCLSNTEIHEFLSKNIKNNN